MITAVNFKIFNP